MNENASKIKLLIIISLTVILGGSAFCFPKIVNAQEEPGNLSNLRILYQGQLTDSQGNPVEDGRYNIRFRIYDAEEGGNVLWQEEYTFYNGISVENGQFKVILGRGNPINLNLDKAPFWLGITLGTLAEENQVQWGEEIQPRKKITTLSELFGVEELTPEQWGNLSQLIKEKLGDETDVVLLFDIAQLESLGTEQGINFPSSIISFFQNFINFISEKISEIGEKLNQILTKIDGMISTLANIKYKIDALYNVLIVEKGLGPAETKIELPETSSEEISYSKQKVERLIFIGGETSVIIFNQLIKEGSLIFITFLDDPGSGWWISEKVPGQSFTISLKEPAPQDLRFDYWILDKEVSVCTPNWSCTEWQSLPETVACGESFTQARTCTDSNSCGTEEGKPIVEQKTTGTNTENCGLTFCDPDGTLHLMGQCPDTCLEGSCQFCTPQCTCVEGFYDDDNDLTNGCVPLENP